METTTNITYDQVWTLVQQLPYRDKEKLQSQIKRTLAEKKKQRIEENTTGSTDFQKFLLQGPTMSDEQFENFKTLRKDFNQWLEK